MPDYDLHEKAVSIVVDAGGELVGRTRLQKIAYLIQLVGFSDDFPFEYHHFGPYSEELADAVRIATGLKLIAELERQSTRGGWYSVFRASDEQLGIGGRRSQFITAAAKIGAIELELAATAAYLYSSEGIGRDDAGDPWVETAHRKPEKAGEGRLEKAKSAYRELMKVDAPIPLPAIV